MTTSRPSLGRKALSLSAGDAALSARAQQLISAAKETVGQLCLFQATCKGVGGAEVVWSRAMALSMMSNLRMQATMATLLEFPAGEQLPIGRGDYRVGTDGSQR